MTSPDGSTPSSATAFPSGRGRRSPPILRLDPARSSELPGVLFDLEPALAELAEHLRTTGVRRAVVLDSAATGPSDRAERIRTGLLGEIEDVRIEPLGEAGIGAQVRAALAASPDLLAGWNDAHALATLKELRAQGVAVPEQVRVIGIDGLGIGTLVTPELTTIGVDFAAVAREAVDLVDGMFAGRLPLHGTQSRREVPYRVMLRGSA